ncbi:hypothetical protein [Trabulsiella odontotermitis]|uniref:hypothetical protein n=1 Tax=Trabulsiella odontotermitis TaxID=379893 RepID=UPI0006BA24DF|nr:hypothetical protein [Trabulsiella odontotermitis]
MDFLKRWLKYQVGFLARTYIPAIAIFIFFMVAVKFFPAYAVQSTGVFAVVVFIVIYLTAKPSK